MLLRDLFALPRLLDRMALDAACSAFDRAVAAGSAVGADVARSALAGVAVAVSRRRAEEEQEGEEVHHG